MAVLQSIFDTLATAAGHPINRAGLNVQMAQAESMGRYRDAQTQDMLDQAAQRQQAAQAYEEHHNALQNLAGQIARRMGIDPDMATGIADGMLKDGPQGYTNYLKALDENDQYRFHQTYINAAATDKPAILGMAVDSGMPWAVAEVKQRQETMQAAETLREGQLREGLINAQTAAANANAQKTNAMAQNGGLSPGAMEMGAYISRKFGGQALQAMGISTFGSMPARTAIANEVQRQIQANEPLQDNPAYDDMFNANQRSQVQQHGMNAAAGSTFGAGQLSQISKLDNAMQHLQLVPALREALGAHDIGAIQNIAARLNQHVVGDPATWANNYLAQGLGSEITGAYSALGGGVNERLERQKDFSANVPDAAVNANIDTAVQMLGGVYKTFEQRAVNVMGGMNPSPGLDAQNRSYARGFLAPGTQLMLHNHGIQLDPILPQPQVPPNGGPAAQPGPSGAPTPAQPAASTGPAGSPPRLTQTPPGTPGGTPAGSAPGAQPAPAGGAPTQPNTANLHPNSMPLTGPDGGPGPDVSMIPEGHMIPMINPRTGKHELWANQGGVVHYVGPAQEALAAAPPNQTAPVPNTGGAPSGATGSW